MIQNPAIQGGGTSVETVTVSLNVNNEDGGMSFYAVGIDQNGNIAKIHYASYRGETFDVVKNTICVFETAWPGMNPPKAKVVGNVERVDKSVGDPLSEGEAFIFRPLGDCSIEFV